jgi:nucleoside-diphosphate-sugar epimerase
MGKVFITGSTGFVGINLIEYLAVRSKTVVGVSRKKNETSTTIDYLNFDSELLSAGTVVIHLAGKAHDLKKTSNDNGYYEANFELTKRLYDQFLKSDAKIFIYTSSVKAAADSVIGVLTEEDLPHPMTTYGKSKLMAEEYILSKELAEGKRVYILRPCMIHGPGNKGNLNLLFQMVKKGLPWPLGAFENSRSFLSVENLCFIINELLENESVPSGVYQVADDEPISTNELIDLLGTALGKKNKIWSINASVIQSIARMGDVIPFPLNSERLRKLTENYVVSNTKIISAIGKPLPLRSKEGLLKTFNSFK